MHLLAHWKCLIFSSICFLNSLLMNVLRFLIIVVRLVVKGGLDDLDNMVWAMCICGMGDSWFGCSIVC